MCGFWLNKHSVCCRKYLSVVKSNVWCLRRNGDYRLLQSYVGIQIKADGLRGYGSMPRSIWLPSEHSHLPKDVCVAILQSSGIRLCFYAIVWPGRMPPIYPESIGGIFTGFSSYLGRFCVPPYSQNPTVAAPYMLVYANNASGSGWKGMGTIWLFCNCLRAMLVNCDMVTIMCVMPHLPKYSTTLISYVNLPAKCCL